jgi:cytochrome P450
MMGANATFTKVSHPRASRAVANLVRFRKAPIRFMQEIRERYGDVVRLWLGPRKFYFVSSAEGAERVLKDNVENYPKSTLVFGMIRPITGKDGLVQLEGDAWAEVRKQTNPLFFGGGVERSLSTIRGCVDDMCGEWAARAGSGKSFDVCHGITDAVLRISGKILFSSDFYAEASELGERFVDINRICGERIRSVIYAPGFIPTRRNRKLKDHQRAIKQLSQRLLSQHAHQAPDLIGSLERLPAVHSSEFLVNQMMTFLFAGHEATATSICWAIYALAAHPEWQEEIRTEAKTIGENPSWKELQSCARTYAVYREAMRLYPPAWILAREVKEDDSLGDTKIDSKAQLLLSVREIHRHPDLWDRPDTFDPQRFLGRVERHPFAFIPFSAGPRICSGVQLAYAESIYTLLLLTKRFRLTLDKSHPIGVEEMITARPKHGVWIGLENHH